MAKNSENENCEKIYKELLTLSSQNNTKITNLLKNVSKNLKLKAKALKVKIESEKKKIENFNFENFSKFSKQKKTEFFQKISFLTDNQYQFFLLINNLIEKNNYMLQKKENLENMKKKNKKLDFQRNSVFWNKIINTNNFKNYGVLKRI